MGRNKKNFKKQLDQTAKSPPSNFSAPARNLRTTELGGVIFGCTNKTYDECYSKELFGLPSTHMAYVKNIRPGLVLFLFNYSDRTLHGIFEASSTGQKNIDPRAWTDEYSADTLYPAQVRVKIQRQCRCLTEDQFKPILAENYYEPRLFYFELTRAQTEGLLALFSSSPVNRRPSLSLNLVTRNPAPRSINNQQTRHADDVTDDWEALADFENSNQSLTMQWNESNNMSHCKFAEEAVEDLQLKCPRSYSSVVGGDTSLPLKEKKWSSLFKAPQAWEGEGQSYLNEKPSVPTSDQCHMDKVSNFSWEDHAHELADWKSESDNPELSACAKVEDLVPSTIDQDSHSAGEEEVSNSDTDESYNEEVNDVESENNNEELQKNSSVVEQTMHVDDTESLVNKLIQQFEELKCSQLKQISRISYLEKELVKAKKEIHHMKQRFPALESAPFTEDFILIVGGFNGDSWLYDTDEYSPSLDRIRSLRPMPSLRKYASAAKSRGEIFVLGGVSSEIVESYNLTTGLWATRKPMNHPRGCLAGACLYDHIYAIGGADGTEYFSDVEMFDPNIEKWLFTMPMQQARIALAAAELGGVLYAVGGCFEASYLNSAERYDPRENLWSRVGSMRSCRGCHSLVAVKDKLYAIGGHDGSQMLETVEIYEPRTASWMPGDSMTTARGYSAAFTVADSIYVIGGLQGDSQTDFATTIECYREGCGWVVTGLNAITRRCHFSALKI